MPLQCRWKDLLGACFIFEIGGCMSTHRVDGEESGRESDEKKAGDDMVEHSTGKSHVKERYHRTLTNSMLEKLNIGCITYKTLP